MSRRPFYSPNAEKALLERWRADGRIRAVGALTCAGGAMSGKHLAGVLGMSPRGLRQFLVKDDLIVVEIREVQTDKGPRGETWYRLNMRALPPPPEAPPLRIEAPPKRAIRGPRGGNCGPVAGPGQLRESVA